MLGAILVQHFPSFYTKNCLQINKGGKVLIETGSDIEEIFSLLIETLVQSKYSRDLILPQLPKDLSLS